MTTCALCTAPIPAPADGRHARRRYCSDTCRKIAWKQRHQARPADPDVVTVTGDVTNTVTDATPIQDQVPTRGSQHRCPRCHQPLAVVSVIVPAAAATITPPEAP